MTDGRYSRNEALFGPEGQEKIASTKVTIVGVGGLGSHVAQQLAYLGVVTQTPVDFDIVTISSMNRLVGAVDTDLAAKTKKVIVAKRMIAAINPDAIIEPVDAKVDTPEAEAAIAAADTVIGCLDRDLPRLKLTELCSRYAKPLFDLATDTGGQGDDLWYGGRVVFANGAGCLVCRNLLDQQEMTRDSMSLEQREVQERIYGVERGALGETGPDGRLDQRRRLFARRHRIHGFCDRDARARAAPDLSRPRRHRRPQQRPAGDGLLLLHRNVGERAQVGGQVDEACFAATPF